MQSIKQKVKKSGILNVQQLIIYRSFLMILRTMKYEEQGMKVELSYEISNDVLTIKKVKNSVVSDNDFFSNYMKVAKFKKVK